MEFFAELHPRIVHFPIAFFSLYFLLETPGILFKKDYLMKSAYIVLTLGVVFALLSVLTGNQAHEFAITLQNGNNTVFSEYIERHKQYATITLWYYLGVLVFRTYVLVRKKLDTNLGYLFIVLSLIGCMLIYLTGVYGGRLVFEFGIGTKFFGS